MAENWLDQALIVCNAIINPDHILLMDQYSHNTYKKSSKLVVSEFKGTFINL